MCENILATSWRHASSSASENRLMWLVSDVQNDSKRWGKCNDCVSLYASCQNNWHTYTQLVNKTFQISTVFQWNYHTGCNRIIHTAYINVTGWLPSGVASMKHEVSETSSLISISDLNSLQYRTWQSARQQKQVHPKVIWKEWVTSPHIRECTLPLYVLAYGTITECYGTLWSVTEALWNCCEALWNITERYGSIM